MEDPLHRLYYLLDKYKASTCTKEERSALQTLLRAEWEGTPTDGAGSFVDWEAMYHRIMDEDIRTKKIGWRRYVAVAASVLFVAGSVYIFKAIVHHRSIRLDENVTGQIRPGGDHATLVLPNGSTILLDTASNGVLVDQGAVRAVKTGDGVLAFQPAGGDGLVPGQSLLNKVSTPTGGIFRVVLPDGTRVWLNSASSIRFPTVFTGGLRQVELTGEAYFEVAVNKSQPFIVKSAQTEVTVLGTRFNINAYGDEPLGRITLAEGGVRVVGGATAMILHPGRQALMDMGSHSLMEAEADVAVALAWKDGIFEFKNDDIATIMRQVSRWYDVDVQYDYRTTETFVASIQRKEPLPRLLSLLESTGHVHFKIEGRTVRILR